MSQLPDAWISEVLYRSLTKLPDLEERRLTLSTPLPGSDLADDDFATAPHNMSHGVVNLLGSTIEHLGTLEDILRSEKPLRAMSGYTLCRAALETSSAALHLVLPRDRPTRVLRRLQMIAEDERNCDFVATEAKQPLRPSLDERLDELRALGAAQGLGPGACTTRLPSSDMVRAADIARGDKKSVELAWKMCSGFAHGKQWASLMVLERGLETDLGGDNVRVDLSASPSALAWSVALATGVATMALNRAERMAGRK